MGKRGNSQPESLMKFRKKEKKKEKRKEKKEFQVLNGHFWEEMVLMEEEGWNCREGEGEREEWRVQIQSQ